MFQSQHVSLGPFTLNTYTLLIALAALACVLIRYWQTRDERVFAAALVIGLAALACGRAGYVALNWDYFREHTNDIFALNGLSEHAALAGATIGYWLLAIHKYPLANSQLPIAFTLTGIASSVGCIPNGCAYGREVFWQTDGANSLAWLLRADWPDAYLVNNPRWPTQALLAGWLLVAATILFALTRRKGDRERGRNLVSLSSLSPLSFLVFAAGDFLIQFLRGDAAIMVAGLRVYQWLDVLLIGLLLVVFVIRARRPNQRKL